MANLSVTYQELRDVAARLVNGQQALEDQLTALKRAVDALVGAGFRTDSASGAFAGSYEDFTSGVSQTVSGLEGMATFLTRAADAYERTDRELAAAIGR